MKKPLSTYIGEGIAYLSMLLITGVFVAICYRVIVFLINWFLLTKKFFY